MKKENFSDEIAIAASQSLIEKEYWLKKLSLPTVKSSFPYDHMKKYPGFNKFSKDSVKFTFSIEISSMLMKLSREFSPQLFIILTTGVVILLHKYSGNQDIILGIPIDKQEVEGEFINTVLALRNQVNPGITFRELLLQVQELIVEAIRHQNYPIEELLNNLDMAFEDNDFPLFDVAVLLEDIHEKKYLSSVHPNILFSFSNKETEISGAVEFNPLVYEKPTIERIMTHYSKLLEISLRDVDVKVSDIDLISEQEKQKLIFDFNAVESIYPKDKTIHQLFAAQVEKTTDHIASVGIGFGTQGLEQKVEITYRELDQRANHLALELKAKGIGPDAIVGVLLERSIDMVIALLGILKAGGAYLPIDVDYPGNRIDYMLVDSLSEVLVTTQDLVKGESQAGIIKWKRQMVFLDELLTLFDRASSLRARPSGSAFTYPTNPEPLEPIAGLSQSTADYANLAYIMYTSGTTAKPKGVMVSHRNVIRLVKNTNFIQLNQETRILQTGAPVFDATTFEIWGSLLNGGQLVLAHQNIILEVDKLASLLVKSAINTLWLTSPLFNQLSRQNPLLFSPLRYLLVGGDILSPSHVNEVKRKFPGLNIINGYGPTENTTFSTTHLIEKEYQDNIPIGRPIANSLAYIVDRFNHPQPIGIFGELCVGGNGVSRGYLNNPELTAEKFIQNPFLSRSTNDRLYRTGDFTRWLPGSDIEFLGRIDHQVKIRGFRIEPSEIEECLLNHEVIEEAVVIAKTTTAESARVEDDANGDKTLYAYFVVKKEIEKKVDIAQLREYLSCSLPSYMIPSYFIQLEKIPLTPNGKINQKALPDPGPSHSQEYAAPRNELEKQLVAIWANILGMNENDISIDSNFFELGGDSIKSIQFSSRLKKYNLQIEIKDLFENPTIKELGKHVKKIKHVIDQELVKGYVELTPIQQWFFENNLKDQHHFNQSIMIYSKYGFSEEIIKAVFHKILQHHDALRMIYEFDEDRVNQINLGLEGQRFDFELINLESTSTSEIEKNLEKEANRIQRGINLSAGPLVKLGLFRTIEGDHLLVVIHHLVVDGVSWRILLEDFVIGYQQVERGEKIKFQDKTDSYQKWASELIRYSQSQELLKEMAYWNEIQQVSTPAMPSDHEMSIEEVKGQDNDIIRVEFTPQDTDKLLKKANHAYNTEINDLLLAALGLTIQEWAHIDRVLINLEGHGREGIIEGIDITRTVGWFTTQFPVVLDMRMGNDLSYSIRTAKETLRRIPNKGIGYGIIRYLVPAEKKPGFSFGQEPEISFNYLGQVGQEFDQGNPGKYNPLQVKISEMKMGDTRNSYFELKRALFIDSIVIEGKLHLSFYYNRCRYRKSTIQDLSGFFQRNLLKIIDHCMTKEEQKLTPSDLVDDIEISIEELEEIQDFTNSYIQE